MSINDERHYVQFQIFSLNPLPQSLRVDFQLPGNPYSIKERGEKAREYLKNFSVFFFRDQDHTEAVLIQPEDGDNTSLLNRTGFHGFKSMGILSRETMKVGEWDKPISMGAKRKIDKYIEKKGDKKAWLVWNKEGTVVSIGELEITFV